MAARLRPASGGGPSAPARNHLCSLLSDLFPPLTSLLSCSPLSNAHSPLVDSPQLTTASAAKLQSTLNGFLISAPPPENLALKDSSTSMKGRLSRSEPVLSRCSSESLTKGAAAQVVEGHTAVVAALLEAGAPIAERRAQRPLFLVPPIHPTKEMTCRWIRPWG